MVSKVLISVGHHGSAAVPTAPSDDVHGVDGECVGGAHHRTDVGVVTKSSRSPRATDGGGCRCRRRSRHGSSTGRRRRHCECRRARADPGRNAGHREAASHGCRATVRRPAHRWTTPVGPGSFIGDRFQHLEAGEPSGRPAHHGQRSRVRPLAGRPDRQRQSGFGAHRSRPGAVQDCSCQPAVLVDGIRESLCRRTILPVLRGSVSPGSPPRKIVSPSSVRIRVNTPDTSVSSTANSEARQRADHVRNCSPKNGSSVSDAPRPSRRSGAGAALVSAGSD